MNASLRALACAILTVTALALTSTPGRADTATPATLTPADQGWVHRVQDALNAITTLKARFLQIAPDGATTQGTAWLDRPGRMRFEYDRPSPLLLVANNGEVVFRDRKLDQVTTIPLTRTPLGLLLAPDVSLSGNVTVTGFVQRAGTIQLTLERTASPGDGSLTLVFSDQPFALRSWTVLDAQGRETRVDLYDVTTGGAFSDSLFAVSGNG
jgi:outer membrane lipoprotein-sorting protein